MDFRKFLAEQCSSLSLDDDDDRKTLNRKLKKFLKDNTEKPKKNEEKLFLFNLQTVIAAKDKKEVINVFLKNIKEIVVNDLPEVCDIMDADEIPPSWQNAIPWGSNLEKATKDYFTCPTCKRKK